jgi:hypothetical protein
MHTNIKLLLEIGHCNGAMDMIVQDRSGTIDRQEKISQSTLELNYSIALPNQLTIKLSGKNYNTDTLVDNNGNITQNKYIKLKKLWFGKIELNELSLIQICCYQTDRDTQSRFSTLWDSNGTVTMDLFDKTSIEFLLHLHNKLDIPTTQ